MDKLILNSCETLQEYKFIREPKQPKHLEKEEHVGGHRVPSFQTYCRATIFKQFGVGIRIHAQINGIELEVQK